MDVCGVDYLDYNYDNGHYQQSNQASNGAPIKQRFAVVYHLLSITHNHRVRVRVFTENDDLPRVSSLCHIWSSVNWFEREVFDMFGIVFEGHPDLRRILTDYDFEGYPFRKDFPISGHVEIIYDKEEGRVKYQPVTIAPREITPRIIREENYCGRE